ncbi:MAG: WD40 repeat domain-containing protein [Pirellulaceae bacterium]|nr:WD40 repeat domain-containing protein [Pirellulaceae bacterium]
MPQQIMRRSASDNQYLHQDFHDALSAGIEYLDRNDGEQAVRDCLWQFARSYYAPLTASLRPRALLVLLSVAVGSGCRPAIVEQPRVRNHAVRHEPVLTPERWLNFDEASLRVEAVHPEGKYAVVKSGCRTILYDLEAGTLVYSWVEQFSSVEFSGNGRFLLTVGDNEVAVWETKGAGLVRRWEGDERDWSEPPSNHVRVYAKISHDGAQIAVSNRQQAFDHDLPDAVLLFDTVSGVLRRTLSPPETKSPIAAAFTRSGTRLLVRDFHGSALNLLDTVAGEVVCNLPDRVKVHISPDGHWIAAGGAVIRSRPREEYPGDLTLLKIWDTASGEPVAELQHEHPMRDWAFSPDGRRIFVALEKEERHDGSRYYSGRLVEWDWRTGRKTVEGEDHSNPYTGVAYSTDGRRRFAVTEYWDELDTDFHQLHGWMVDSGDKLPIQADDVPGAMHDLFFFPNGDRYISKRLFAFAVRDVLTGETVQTLPNSRLGYQNVALVPGTASCLIGGVHRLDPVSGKHWPFRLPAHGEIAFADDGRLLFACGNTRLYLIDVAAREIVWEMGLTGTKYDAAVSPDAGHIAVALHVEDFDGLPAPRLVLIDTSVPDGVQLFDRFVSAVAFHPDGDRFLAATPDAIVECDAVTGEEIRTLFDTPGRSLTICYSRDGRRVLAGGVQGRRDHREPVDVEDDAWVATWDADTGEPVRFQTRRGPVSAAAFSPDGRHCVTGSLDGGVFLWETESGASLTPLEGHIGKVNAVCFFPGGGRIVTAADDGAAFWNVARITSPLDLPLPLAETLSQQERFFIERNTLGIDSPLHGKFTLARKGFQPGAAPVLQPQDWTIVAQGETPWYSLPPDVRQWLSHGRSVKHRSPQRAMEPPFGHGDTPCSRSRDGQRVAYCSWALKKVTVCDRQAGILRVFDTTTRPQDAALSPSGDELVIVHDLGQQGACSRYELTVYDVNTGDVERIIDPGEFADVSTVSIGPMEETIMCRLAGSFVVVHDFQTGSKIGDLRAAGRAEYSPEGRFIARSYYSDLSVHLYDRCTVDLKKSLTNYFPVNWFEFSPDGKRLLVGQDNRLITLWDIDAGKRLWTSRGYAGGETEFSTDGKRFLSRSHDMSILWDAELGKVLCVVLEPNGEWALPVLGRNGDAIHLGTADGPMIWSNGDETVPGSGL